MDRLILIQEEPRNASELVEVPVTIAGSNRIPFPDNQQLRSLTTQSIVIQAIRLITPQVLTNAPINGFDVAPVAELQKAVLVLYCEGWEKAHYIPLLVLNDTGDPVGGAAQRYHATKFSNWRNVDWSKSYILYANGTGGAAGVPYTVLFDVEYTKLDAAGHEIIGPS